MLKESPLPPALRMRIRDAVSESQTSTSTIHRMVKSGDLSAVRFGRTILIDRASFDAAFRPVAAE